MKKVLAVSAGEIVSKKSFNIIRDRIKYLNYGLLGLATILRHRIGIDIAVFQGDHLPVNDFIAMIEQSGIDIANDCECVLLSIPSYYSLSWCQTFCKAMKEIYNQKIIVGGRWVVDHNSSWVTEKLVYVDRIIEGFGEKPLCSLFHPDLGADIEDGSKKCFDWLDYTLLYNYRKYQPCIEVSRGCGSGCQFCADKNHRRLPNKSVSHIIRELNYLDSIYNDFSVYLEAPHFIFEKQWTQDLYTQLLQRKKPQTWRCTTRVESVPLDRLPMLRECGLKVIDVGLESASKIQLMRMKKTGNPDKYLELAEKILLACQDNDIWIKFNLLLYAGETSQTIQETMDWLVARKDLIKDVSVSSLVYYKDMASIQEILNLGASIPIDKNINDAGYVNLNLSPEIDASTAKEFAVKIPKLIANQKDFFDIKSISYFENGYTYRKFLADLKKCDMSELPFSINNTIQ